LLGEGLAALPPGTRVRAEGLFDKVPARRKFLRSPRAEYAACLDVVKRLAMARPDVAFSVDHDGRRNLSVQPSDGPTRVAALLSHELDRHGIGIDCVREGLRLTGVVSLPTFNRGMADQQYLFVNSRPVKDRLLVGALRAAYRDLLARDRHPVAALFVEVPTSEVDINVHPAKTEVRFRDPAAVRGLIVGGLKAALDEAGHRSAAREQFASRLVSACLSWRSLGKSLEILCPTWWGRVPSSGRPELPALSAPRPAVIDADRIARPGFGKGRLSGRC